MLVNAVFFAIACQKLHKMCFHPFSSFNIFQTIPHIGTVFFIALTLSFPQAFTDAATKCRVKFGKFEGASLNTFLVIAI